jgi:hypothetical protein
MRLTQLLLPVCDNEGSRFDAALFGQVRDELIDRFGGLTVYTRAPVHGLWQEDGKGETVSDELIIFEVMSERPFRRWWQRYRRVLERRFRQQQILIRTHKIAIL